MDLEIISTNDRAALRLVIRWHRASRRTSLYNGRMNDAAAHAEADRVLSNKLYRLSGDDDCHTPAAWRKN